MKPPEASRNCELKIKCTKAVFETARSRARAAGRGPLASLRQVDSYFNTKSGRLKLREIESGEGTSAELIAHHRGDEVRARWSSCHRAPSASESATDLKAGLAGTLGLETVVTKMRGVLILEQTRVHFDLVEGLGRFIELETVVDEHCDAPPAEMRRHRIAELLGLDNQSSIEGSYRDLVEPRG